jgi:FKBP-type peptidyl-prolyl cis-trans isomerase 2
VTAVRYSVLNQDKSNIVKQSPEQGAEFVLKEGVAVPAIPVALKTMKKGEKASLIIKSGCKISSYSWHTHGKREMRSSY